MEVDKFEEIMMAAIDEAEKIKCPLEDYYKGLQAMRSCIQERIDGVASELGHP